MNTVSFLLSMINFIHELVPFFAKSFDKTLIKGGIVLSRLYVSSYVGNSVCPEDE